MLVLECTQTIGQVPWGLRSAKTNKSGTAYSNDMIKWVESVQGQIGAIATHLLSEVFHYTSIFFALMKIL